MTEILKEWMRGVCVGGVREGFLFKVSGKKTYDAT